MDSNHNKQYQKLSYYRYTKWENCGKTGIRTPEPITVAGFQDRCIQPLCHLSSCSSFRAVKQILHVNGMDAIWERADYSEVMVGVEPTRCI